LYDLRRLTVDYAWRILLLSAWGYRNSLFQRISQSVDRCRGGRRC